METFTKPDQKLTSILGEATNILGRRRPKNEGSIAPEQAAPGVKKIVSKAPTSSSGRVDPNDTAPGVMAVDTDTGAEVDELPGTQAQSSHEAAELDFANLGEEDFMEELARLQRELGEEGGALDGDDDDDEQYGHEEADGEDTHQMELSPDEDPEAGQEMGPAGPEDAEHPEEHPEHPDMSDEDPEMQADGVDGGSDPMASEIEHEPHVEVPMECPNCGENALPDDMECVHCGAELPVEANPEGEGDIGHEPGMGDEMGGEGGDMGPGDGAGMEMGGGMPPDMEPMGEPPSDGDAMGNDDEFNGNSADGLEADPLDPIHGHPDDAEPVESLGEATESLRDYTIRANKALNAGRYVKEAADMLRNPSVAVKMGGTQRARQIRESLIQCSSALNALRPAMATIIQHSRSLESYAGRGINEARKVESYVRRHKLRSFLSDMSVLSEAAMGMNKSFRMGSHNSAIAYMNRMAQRAAHLADVAKTYLKNYKGSSHPKMSGAVDRVRSSAHSAYGHARNAASSLGNMVRRPQRQMPSEMETHMEARNTRRVSNLNEAQRMLYEADNPSASGSTSEDDQTSGTQEVPQQMQPGSSNTLEIPSHYGEDMSKREAFEKMFLQIFTEALRQEEAQNIEEGEEIACSNCESPVNEADESCGNCGATFEA
jgi:hypothetical protein